MSDITESSDYSETATLQTEASHVSSSHTAASNTKHIVKQTKNHLDLLEYQRSLLQKLHHRLESKNFEIDKLNSALQMKHTHNKKGKNATTTTKKLFSITKTATATIAEESGNNINVEEAKKKVTLFASSQSQQSASSQQQSASAESEPATMQSSKYYQTMTAINRDLQSENKKLRLRLSNGTQMSIEKRSKSSRSKSKYHSQMAEELKLKTLLLHKMKKALKKLEVTVENKQDIICGMRMEHEEEIARLTQLAAKESQLHKKLSDSHAKLAKTKATNDILCSKIVLLKDERTEISGKFENLSVSVKSKLEENQRELRTSKSQAIQQKEEITVLKAKLNTVIADCEVRVADISQSIAICKSKAEAEKESNFKLLQSKSQQIQTLKHKKHLLLLKNEELLHTNLQLQLKYDQDLRVKKRRFEKEADRLTSNLMKNEDLHQIELGIEHEAISSLKTQVRDLKEEEKQHMRERNVVEDFMFSRFNIDMNTNNILFMAMFVCVIFALNYQLFAQIDWTTALFGEEKHDQVAKYFDVVDDYHVSEESANWQEFRVHDFVSGPPTTEALVDAEEQVAVTFEETDARGRFAVYRDFISMVVAYTALIFAATVSFLKFVYPRDLLGLRTFLRRRYSLEAKHWRRGSLGRLRSFTPAQVLNGLETAAQ